MKTYDLMNSLKYLELAESLTNKNESSFYTLCIILEMKSSLFVSYGKDSEA